MGRTDARVSKIPKTPDQSEGVVPDASGGDLMVSGPFNLAFFRYKPAKTNDMIIRAMITKIDSIIVNPIIFVFIKISLFSLFILPLNDT